jgi:hypothetical protein
MCSAIPIVGFHIQMLNWGWGQVLLICSDLQSAVPHLSGGLCLGMVNLLVFSASRLFFSVFLKSMNLHKLKRMPYLLCTRICCMTSKRVKYGDSAQKVVLGLVWKLKSPPGFPGIEGKIKLIFSSIPRNTRGDLSYGG